MNLLETTIGHRNGLHARPAAEIAKVVRDSGANVTVIDADGNGVNGASMLSLMKHGFSYNAKVTVRVEGAESSRTADAVAEILARTDD